MKTEEEINDELTKAYDNENCNSGLSYVEGVKSALNWVVEMEDEKPLEGCNDS